MRIQEARADEKHAGLQAVFFACFTEPAVPLEELEPHVAEHKAWIAAIER
jgi:DNA-binding helix-hairpin-helix protein with protein kinase domain